MFKFISKLLGGSKSEKDVQKIMPVVQQALSFGEPLAGLSNEALRNKTAEFKSRIQAHLAAIDAEILEQKTAAEQLPVEDIHGRDEIYRSIDKLKKDRDKKIEEILFTIQPEAFAVVKETARRFTQQTEMRSAATQLDRDLSVRKTYITIECQLKQVFGEGCLGNYVCRNSPNQILYKNVINCPIYHDFSSFFSSF